LKKNLIHLKGEKINFMDILGINLVNLALVDFSMWYPLRVYVEKIPLHPPELSRPVPSCGEAVDCRGA
jgi:hypothetical protein